jgi:hypothetical protein
MQQHGQSDGCLGDSGGTGRADAHALRAGAGRAWVLGSPTVLVGGLPALNSDAKLMCAWAGVIQIAAPGQATCMVP